jgi:hypothetical protein
MVGLRDIGVILVKAPHGPYVQFREVFYMPIGLVVGGKLRSRERVCPRSLSVVGSW